MITTEPALSIQLAIESTIYLLPFEEGLAYDEILEIVQRLGYQKGELNDAIAQLSYGTLEKFFGDDRYRLKDGYIWFSMLWYKLNPDPIRPQVKNYIFKALIQELKSQGTHNFSVALKPLVQQLLDENPSFNKQEVISFFRLMHLSKLFNLTEDHEYIVKPNKSMLSEDHLKTILNNNDVRPNSEKFHTIKQMMKDVISRRKFDTPISSDPLTALGEMIPKLDAGKFELWWIQMTTELRNLDYKRFHSSSLLISCALCEGALSFLINKTKDHEHQMIKTLEMDKPRNWKFPGLIKAASSGTNPVLKDEKLRHSLEKMNDHRKRIHPAAFFPEAGGIPDLKPEQAKTAIDTTEELSRAIIDWSLQNLKQ